MRYPTLFVLIILAGCAPWPTTTQPAITIKVLNEDSSPIEGAGIKFASYKMAMTPEASILELKTNSNGVASLAKKSHIQIVILAPDGGYSYDWSYCIEKDGYRAVAKNQLSKSNFKNGEIIEKLVKAENESTCKWRDFPHGFIISNN